MIWLVDGAANEALPPHRDPRLTEPRRADIGARLDTGFLTVDGTGIPDRRGSNIGCITERLRSMVVSLVRDQ